MTDVSTGAGVARRDDKKPAGHDWDAAEAVALFELDGAIPPRPTYS